MAVKVKKEKNHITRERTPSFEELLVTLQKKRSRYTRENVIKSLKEEIESYEKKYKMSTSEFIKCYEKGEFEMDDRYPDNELFDWYSAYLSQKELLSEG
jgi:hypothetical protein